MTRTAALSGSYSADTIDYETPPNGLTVQQTSGPVTANGTGVATLVNEQYNIGGNGSAVVNVTLTPQAQHIYLSAAPPNLGVLYSSAPAETSGKALATTNFQYDDRVTASAAVSVSFIWSVHINGAGDTLGWNYNTKRPND